MVDAVVRVLVVVVACVRDVTSTGAGEEVEVDELDNGVGGFSNG